MRHKKGQAAAATHPNNTDAKIGKTKQICKVSDFFLLYDGSTLSVSDATGVARCSVCYYVRELLNMDVIGLIGRRRGRTGRLMKVYSSDRTKWLTNHKRQLSLFDLWEGGAR
jgi:hypothetical protein